LRPYFASALTGLVALFLGLETPYDPMNNLPRLVFLSPFPMMIYAINNEVAKVRRFQ
jgi:hypothetical protein